MMPHGYRRWLRNPMLLRGAQPILPVRPEEPDNPAQQQDSYDRVELMEVLAERAPVLAEFHAEVSRPCPPSQKRGGRPSRPRGAPSGPGGRNVRPGGPRRSSQFRRRQAIL